MKEVRKNQDSFILLRIYAYPVLEYMVYLPDNSAFECKE
jgi:hypothetical protein